MVFYDRVIFLSTVATFLATPCLADSEASLQSSSQATSKNSSQAATEDSSQAARTSQSEAAKETGGPVNQNGPNAVKFRRGSTGASPSPLPGKVVAPAGNKKSN